LNPEISLWAGNVVFMAHSGFMPKRATKPDQIKELETFEKRDLALRNTIAKRLDRLDASHNALRVVEKATGGKLIESNRRSRR
jgi:hypothetical protein